MAVPENTMHEAKLARVYERNRNAYAKEVAQATGGWVLEEGDIRLWAAPFPSPFNGLMSPPWKAAEQDTKFCRALQLYQTTGRGMVVALGPASQPDVAYRGILQHYRFQCVYHVPYFHLDLSTYRGKAKRVSGVTIEHLDKTEHVTKEALPWIGPLTTPIRRAKFHFLDAELRRRPRRTWQWLAWADGKVIGGVRLFRFRDTGGIYDMEVYEGYRRRGIALALMHHACRQAADLGLKAVGLSASGQAIPLYLKTGFKLAGQWSDFYLGAARLAKFKV